MSGESTTEGGRSGRGREGAASPRAAGREARFPALTSAVGFTLVELAVTILIIVVIVGGLAVGLGGLRRADLTTVAGRIDGAVRYLYQLAAINATPYRLAVDLGEGSWWVEALDQETSACGSFVVKDVRKRDVASADEKKGRKGRFGKGSKDEKAEKAERSRCPEEERDADDQCPAQGFAPVPDKLLVPRKLPQGITFSGLMTTHQQDVQTEGKGYIYFFPNGTAEKAYLYVSSESETFTIETFPLLGKVKVHHVKRDLKGVLRED